MQKRELEKELDSWVDGMREELVRAAVEVGMKPASS